MHNENSSYSAASQMACHHRRNDSVLYGWFRFSFCYRNHFKMQVRFIRITFDTSFSLYYFNEMRPGNVECDDWFLAATHSHILARITTWKKENSIRLKACLVHKVISFTNRFLYDEFFRQSESFTIKYDTFISFQMIRIFPIYLWNL